LPLTGFWSEGLLFEAAFTLNFFGSFWKAGRAFATDVGGRSKLWFETQDQYVRMSGGWKAADSRTTDVPLSSNFCRLCL
jgi:hypothetical protein